MPLSWTLGYSIVTAPVRRDDELAYQEMLKGLELKRDMELILAGTNQAKNAGNDTTARLNPQNDPGDGENGSKSSVLSSPRSVLNRTAPNKGI